MKNKTTQFKTLALAAGIASMGMLAPAAQAAAIVSFEFDTSGGFVAGTGTCSNANCSLALTQLDVKTPSDETPASADTFRNVSWGTPSNTAGAKSNLQINHKSGDILTDGAWVDIDELVHTNNVLLADGGWMTGISIYGAFTLTPGFPDPFVADGINGLRFEETLNTGVAFGNCAAPVGGWPEGYGTLSCPDIYTTIPLDGITQFFQDDDYKYFVEFQFLAGEGAVVENVDATTVRIFTREGDPGVSKVYTQARITSQRIPVPEPGTLALMGLALLGLGATRYRRSR